LAPKSVCVPSLKKALNFLVLIGEYSIDNNFKCMAF
jgi:hypothetical protein